MRFDERASARSAISRSRAPSMAVAMVGSSAGELAAAGAAVEGGTCARRAVGVSGGEGGGCGTNSLRVGSEGKGGTKGQRAWAGAGSISWD